MNVEFVEFKRFTRNTLVGLAVIRIPAINLVIRDVALHTTNGKRWASPSKPMFDKTGKAVCDASGKVQCVNLLNFERRSAADEFSRAVIDAVEQFQPDAFADPLIR